MEMTNLKDKLSQWEAILKLKPENQAAAIEAHRIGLSLIAALKKADQALSLIDDFNYMDLHSSQYLYAFEEINSLTHIAREEIQKILEGGE